MKKLTLILLALCGAAVIGAELPDFKNAKTWRKSGWSKSVYSRTAETMIIERTLEGSGAWCTINFPVTVGEQVTGVADVNYIAKEGKGCTRIGINFSDASGKRVLFKNYIYFGVTGGGFETKKFSVKVPAGATQASIYLCIDGKGKVEFRNVMLSK